MSHRKDRFVANGRVWCPRAQMDVELDECLGCAYLCRWSSDLQVIQCRPHLPATAGPVVHEGERVILA